MVQKIELESKPPLRALPIGTSERILIRTESIKISRHSSTWFTYLVVTLGILSSVFHHFETTKS